jgi:microcystin-dependent protein
MKYILYILPIIIIILFILFRYSKKPSSLSMLQVSSIDSYPIGSIVAFNSDNIPDGWTVCNGTNGTPDLRGRFILGKNDETFQIASSCTGTDCSVEGQFCNAGSQGSQGLNWICKNGKWTVANDKVYSAEAGTLKQTGGEENHTLTADEIPSHNHYLEVFTMVGNGNWWKMGCCDNNSGPTTKIGGLRSGFNPNGEDKPHSNLPPYYVLVYIMKLKNTDIIPRGIINPWSGNIDKIPDGWLLCDGKKYGTIQTPNLKDQFILGKNNNQIGMTGGEKDHTLTISELPSHTHSANETVVNWENSNLNSWYTLQQQSGSKIGAEMIESTYATGGVQTNNPLNPNVTTPHNNLPPYYTLAYIMKI